MESRLVDGLPADAHARGEGGWAGRERTPAPLVQPRDEAPACEKLPLDLSRVCALREAGATLVMAELAVCRPARFIPSARALLRRRRLLRRRHQTMRATSATTTTHVKSMSTTAVALTGASGASGGAEGSPGGEMGAGGGEGGGGSGEGGSEGGARTSVAISTLSVGSCSARAAPTEASESASVTAAVPSASPTVVTTVSAERAVTLEDVTLTPCDAISLSISAFTFTLALALAASYLRERATRRLAASLRRTSPCFQGWPASSLAIGCLVSSLLLPPPNCLLAGSLSANTAAQLPIMSTHAASLME